MNDDHLKKTLAQVRAFLDGTQALKFSLDTKVERYDFSFVAPSSGLPITACQSPIKGCCSAS